ncbi:MAG: DUF1800 family protein [Isosphaeraceae bacterium]
MKTDWLDPYLKDPQGAWSVFEPDNNAPWDIAAASYLYRRAGFGATPAELRQAVRQGPAKAVETLLNGQPKAADGTPAREFSQFSDRIEARLGPDGPLRRIQGLWLQRMVNTPQPALEWLTLFWHNHFATSDVKVQNTGLMVQQIATLRRTAMGPFQEMLNGIAKDPAMLIWLDAAANRRSRPNENFAREVMELFTLGRGNYSEKDIQEAARAYTGWFVIRDQFSFIEQQHDQGLKTVLGKTGNFGGEEIHKILINAPASGMFLARKMMRHYVSETDTLPDALLKPLADHFRDSGGSITALLVKILGSRLFHDQQARWRRVKSPVEFIVGTCRMLDMADPMPPPESLADASAAMGQGLYAPPSVAGWEGGAAWIDTTRLVARTNLSLGICSKSGPLAGKLNLEKWAGRYGAKQPAETVDLLVETLLADAAPASLRAELKAMVKSSGDLNGAAARILTSPAYQLA